MRANVAKPDRRKMNKTASAQRGGK